MTYLVHLVFRGPFPSSRGPALRLSLDLTVRIPATVEIRGTCGAPHSMICDGQSSGFRQSNYSRTRRGTKEPVLETLNALQSHQACHAGQTPAQAERGMASGKRQTEMKRTKEALEAAENG